jgi:hypothetical protein
MLKRKVHNKETPQFLPMKYWDCEIKDEIDGACRMHGTEKRQCKFYVENL